MIIFVDRSYSLSQDPISLDYQTETNNVIGAIFLDKQHSQINSSNHISNNRASRSRGRRHRTNSISNEDTVHTVHTVETVGQETILPSTAARSKWTAATGYDAPICCLTAGERSRGSTKLPGLHGLCSANPLEPVNGRGGRQSHIGAAQTGQRPRQTTRRGAVTNSRGPVATLNGQRALTPINGPTGTLPPNSNGFGADTGAGGADGNGAVSIGDAAGAVDGYADAANVSTQRPPQ
ncbi:hypothetical protein BT63DRAFT_467981 [Microthyrium microscopicum]|uniref:Uncharacterized protein n=1 Tax=Microthyrium microscopicum TaxID=703497 RepID=A0A6A6ULG5_9PEZI|nr:hypothetical protein BT63DRAFT_467981 [Microthyrium microscopicum]